MADGAPVAAVMDNSQAPNSTAFEAQELKTDNLILSTYGLDAIICFNTCFIVPERQHLVQLFFGNYSGTITEPGCYCRNSCFVELRKVSTALLSIDLPNVKVADARGSPLVVSGIVTYQVVDARRAAIDVIDPFKVRAYTAYCSRFGGLSAHE